jgi:histone-lysine N-methyltransferase SETD7
LATRTLEKRTLPVASVASKHVWQILDVKSDERVETVCNLESKTELSHELARASIADKNILLDKSQVPIPSPTTKTTKQNHKSDYKLSLGTLKPEELDEFEQLENKIKVQEHLKKNYSNKPDEKSTSSVKDNSFKVLTGNHQKITTTTNKSKVKPHLKQSLDMFQSEEQNEITKLENTISNTSINTEQNYDAVQNSINSKASNPVEDKSSHIKDNLGLIKGNHVLTKETNGTSDLTKGKADSMNGSSPNEDNSHNNSLINENHILTNETNGANCSTKVNYDLVNGSNLDEKKSHNNSLINGNNCLTNGNHIFTNQITNETNEANGFTKEKVETTTNGIRSKTTFTVPINLLQRWQTMYKTDFVDSDSDSEYEYEEDDPSSPYHTETTLDIEPDTDCLEILTKWSKNVVSHEKDFLEELNRKYVADPKWLIVEEKICHPKTREITGLADVTYCGPIRHGFYREFDVNGKDVTSFGRYVDDEKVGVVWKRLEGDGFLIGVDDNNNNQETTVYLYPDLTCAISGVFEGGKLKSGKFGKVVGLDFDEVGIPVPKVVTLREDVSFTYDPSMSVCISRSPLVRDPYEHQNVYVANSKIEFAGEGLYAKRFLPAGTLVALFNGIRQRETGMMKKMHEFSDYRIGIGSGDVCLDIPDAYVGLDKYCATTGHKACHSFKPNSGFREFRHPRFGRIMSIVAETDLEQNQEVLVSYNYRIHQAPTWYQELYFQHLREDELLGEEGIYMIARRIMRQHEVIVSIPPPSFDSPRFLGCGVCRHHVGYDDFAVSCGRCEKWSHVRCTPLKVEDLFEEDQSGNKIPKNNEWLCHQCVAIS